MTKQMKRKRLFYEKPRLKAVEVGNVYLLAGSDTETNGGPGGEITEMGDPLPLD